MGTTVLFGQKEVAKRKEGEGHRHEMRDRLFYILVSLALVSLISLDTRAVLFQTSVIS